MFIFVKVSGGVVEEVWCSEDAFVKVVDGDAEGFEAVRDSRRAGDLLDHLSSKGEVRRVYPG